MKEKENIRIFISYRRKGGIDTARWLHDQLRIRGYDVFLDMEGLRAGAFNTALYHQIQTSDVFLMVLTKGSLNRCRRTNDWVRQELAYALRCGLNVIPVMHDGFQFPKYLPEDIAPIRMCNGLQISYQFFDAFLNKLEEYIRSEPSNRPSYVPVPEPAKPWAKYAAAVLAIIALGAGITALSRGRDNVSPNPNSSEGHSQQSTTKATQAIAATQVQQTAVQELGNTLGNQCNLGFGGGAGGYGDYSNVHYINTIGNSSYMYYPKSAHISAQLNGGSLTELTKQEDVGYLLATTDWLYYTVESGDTSTLYRAVRPTDTAAIENPAVVTQEISAENQIMIDGEYAYYWRSGRGLYRLNLLTLKEACLLKLETTWEIDTIGKLGDYVYLRTQDSISRVSTETGKHETVLTLSQHIPDSTITAGNVEGTWVYFAITDSGTDSYDHNDRVYRMHLDGSALERAFVADTPLGKIRALCVSETVLYVGSDYGDHACVQLLWLDDWTLAASMNRSEATGYQEIVGSNVGNTMTNLCNSGVVAPKDADTTSYIPSASVKWYNIFPEVSLSYFFDAKDNVIYVQSAGDSKQALVKNAACQYLYVTPDWLYCVLEEDGKSNLYRAENDMENRSIGELQPVLQNISIANNNLAIYDGTIYYWTADKGLFRATPDGKITEMIYDDGGAGKYNGWRTFHITEDRLYFWVASGGIYSVALKDGSLTHPVDTRELDARVTHVVEAGGKFYYVLKYATDGVRTQPDAIWSANYDGSDAKLVCTMANMDIDIQVLNSSSGTLYLKALENGVLTLYKLPPAQDVLKEVRVYD